MDPSLRLFGLGESPAFGQADLSNCEREQLHFAGSIQPQGVLIAVREPDLSVLQISANAPSLLGIPDDNILNRPLSDLGGNLADRLRPHLGTDLDTIPVAVRCRLGREHTQYDCLVHRSPSGCLIIEMEVAGESVDLAAQLAMGMTRILDATSLQSLCDEAVEVYRQIAGYDRVMIYRFDRDGHGAVFAERRRPELEPLLGNRYPASDIPQIARRLYEINRIRVLADVNYEPVPLIPERIPGTGENLDMSLCFLRSMSPIHIQYLKNMGVNATLVASLMVSDELWGLVACHHYAPRFVQYEVRAMCEVLAEAIATRIAGLESFARTQSELSVRRIEQRMIQAISRDGDWRAALFDRSTALLQLADATGAALVFEDQVLTAGTVPGTQDLIAISYWLDKQRGQDVIATVSLGTEEPVFQPLKAIASGMIAVPVSDTPGEYLMWFRPEQIQTVTWGGNPFKPVEVGNDPAELSPRRSFSQWHQIVEGTAEHWTLAEHTGVNMIGASIRDIVIQFRSVRALIARNQLARVSDQVKVSELPVVVFEANGRLFLYSDPLPDLLGDGFTDEMTLDDLPRFFEESSEMENRIQELRESHRAWRGEVHVKSGAAGGKPLLVRTDMVFSSPGQPLGFVVLFMDLSARKAAENARSQFQVTIKDRTRDSNGHLDAAGSHVYRRLMASVFENAQLAALDVTDGADIGKIPQVLESIEQSISRTLHLLAHLVEHAEDQDT